MLKVNHSGYLLLIALFLTMASCQKEDQSQSTVKEELSSISEKVIVPDISGSFRESNKDYNTFYGPAVQMGDGHIRSWVNITTENIPLAIGIEFTAKSFDHLSTNDLDFEGNTFMLMFHQKAMAVTPFDHIMINWNPHGHEPVGIYDVPHFDMHFYKITEAEQMTITDQPTAPPPAGYLPSTYIIQGATVPQMGTHWLDPFNSPELSPAHIPFTHTLIYGSHNAQVIFIEPMITRAFLLSGTSFNTSYPQPIHFSPTGTYYPTAYSIWKDAETGRSYVALTNFVWK